jgi:hypothetical protein
MVKLSCLGFVIALAMSFQPGELLDVRVEGVFTPSESFKYQFADLGHCPAKVSLEEFTSLGNLLLGIRAENSPF